MITDEVTGSSGDLMPGENELAAARFQGKYFAEVAERLTGQRGVNFNGSFNNRSRLDGEINDLSIPEKEADMKQFSLKIAFYVFMILGAAFGTAASAEFSVTIKNLTHGIYFTPFLVSAHSYEQFFFKTGTTASAALQAMAEGGDISGLSTMIGGADADTIENPAGGMLGPGETAAPAVLNTDNTGNMYLSLVAMLLPTNDGFVGLDSLALPSEPGTYTYYLNGYDAGTEANDEIINGGGAPGVAGIPAAPGGDGGTGVTNAELNTTVHIHRGNLGDTDPTGGASDVDSTVHRWLNPVAQVVIEVY